MFEYETTGTCCKKIGVKLNGKIIEDVSFEGGCQGTDFIVQFLNNNGSVADSYYWIDNGEVSAGWYAKGDATEIVGGAASVTIPAGKGAWVIGTGKTLNIPAPEL